MKNTKKTGLILAAAFVLIGALLFVGVMAARHWDFTALGAVEKLETTVFDIDKDITDISLHTDTEDILFKPSEDGKCRVIFLEPADRKPSAAVRGGTLTVEAADAAGKWYQHLSFGSNGSPSVTVLLPRREYAALSIEESTGEITLPKDFSFAAIDISAGTGDVTCFASASGRIRIATDTGDIRVEDLFAGELVLSVSTGRIEAQSVVCGGNADVTVSTGKTVLTDVSCKSLVSGGSTGDISMEKVIAEERISIERSTGDVKLERCNAAELLITTDTGDVTGSLLSEKVFLVRSNTGRVDVPETTSGGKCKITSDTGNIAIRIA